MADDPSVWIVVDQQVAVQVQMVGEAGKVGRRRDKDRTLNHTANHGLQSLRPGGL